MTNWELATENAERMLKEYRHRCRLGPAEYPAHWVGFDIYRQFMQELLDAKDRERQQAVMETKEKCVKAYMEASIDFRGCWVLQVRDAIRDVDAVPVWCEHIEWWTLSNPPSWCRIDEQGTGYTVDPKWTCCPICGAPRPATKGS
jgi:hypothetical protein